MSSEKENTSNKRIAVGKSGAVLLIFGIILAIIEIIYRFIAVPRGAVWIFGWMEYLLAGFILICFLSAVVHSVNISNKKRKLFIAVIILACIFPAVLKGLTSSEKTIIKVSPDYKHIMVLERHNGTVYVNNVYYYLLKIKNDQFPFSVQGHMKYQWLQDDVCAVTYESDDNITHQYIKTFGCRGDGISYSDPITAVSGNWAVTTNHAGLQMAVDGGNIVIKNGSNLWNYSQDDCVRFGDSAAVLCRNGVPEWSLVLNEDCIINYDCLVAEGGTVTLCRVLMDDTSTFVLNCTDEKNEYSDVDPNLNSDNSLADETAMQEIIGTMRALASENGIIDENAKQLGIFFVDSNDEDEEWNVFVALKTYEESFRANGVDTKTSVQSIQRLSGNEKDGFYEVVYKEFCVSPGNQGSQPTGESMEMTERIRMMKASKGFYACVFNYNKDGSLGLMENVGEKKELSGSEEYSFFLQGQYDETYMYVTRRSPKQALEYLYETKLLEKYPKGMVKEYDGMNILDLKGDGTEYILYDGITEDLKNYSFIRVKLSTPGISPSSRMEIKERYDVIINNQ